MNLKLKRKCHIVAPDWLNVGALVPALRSSCRNLTLGTRQEFLQERLTRETTQPQFSELPFRFAEIAKVILDVYVYVLWFPRCT
jgi:GINS complex subunit 2